MFGTAHSLFVVWRTHTYKIFPWLWFYWHASIRILILVAEKPELIFYQIVFKVATMVDHFTSLTWKANVESTNTSHTWIDIIYANHKRKPVLYCNRFLNARMVHGGQHSFFLPYRLGFDSRRSQSYFKVMNLWQKLWEKWFLNLERHLTLIQKNNKWQSLKNVKHRLYWPIVK